MLAGRRAQDRSANVEAIELYERALDVAEGAGATPDEVADVAEALGDVAELAARYETAEAAYERAREAVPDDAITQCTPAAKGRHPERAPGTLLRTRSSCTKARSACSTAQRTRSSAFAPVRTWSSRTRA